MLLDTLADDLLEFLIAVLEKVRIKDRLFNVRVNVELFLDLLEGRGVISVLVRLYLFEQGLDRVMVRPQQVGCIRRFAREYSGNSVDGRSDDSFVRFGSTPR